MRSVVCNCILALSLLLSSPALAQSQVNYVDRIAGICQMDLTHYKNGDKEWLERQLRYLPQESQRMYMRDMCAIYARGVEIGIILSVNEMKKGKLK